MFDASRANKSPPGASTRHISFTIVAKCASSFAKWSTALHMTTCMNASG